MKLSNSFEQFLSNEVNLNQTRVDQADGAFDTLTSFLANHDDVSGLFMDSSKQGSLRQGTIIKPRKDETEFDVDLLVRLEAVNTWSATDYLDTVHAAFRSSDRYKDLVDRRGKHRCVTIDYVNDFHVDVVPSIEVNGRCWIMNRDTNAFEATDGDGYAAWFEGRNTITGGRQLVRVVRLAKYIRDERDWPVKSILLTTLLGLQVSNTDSAATYADTPTALRLLMIRLDTWLQAQKTMPVIVNPALPTEDFIRHWGQKTYSTFRAGVHEITQKIADAYAEPDIEKSLDLWRAVFGEAFPLADEDVEKQAVSLAVIPPIGSISHARPLSDIAPSGEHLSQRVRLDGWVFNLSGTKRFRGINSGAAVPSGRALKFRAWTDTAGAYDVRWQVVNTGAHAAKLNGLRGNYFSGRNLRKQPVHKLENWEVTQYTGRHWIECFIVKNGVCVGRSKPFYINIKNPEF